jgi:hypothetical protein
LDPKFVPALEALALTNYEMGEDEDIPPHAAWQAARAGAERVLQLDQHSATAHGLLGFVYGFDEFNWARADAEIREALAASRRRPENLLLASEVALAEGRSREATELISAAVTVDPLNATYSKSWVSRGSFLGIRPERPPGSSSLSANSTLGSCTPPVRPDRLGALTEL